MSQPTFVFPPRPQAALPIKGSEALFPVHRIYCVGRNFADHAVEMGHDPDAEPPFFFQKNPDNLVLDGRFPYPPRSSDVHYEAEMVIALGTGGKDIATADALAHVYGYAVGIDMTRRDLQGEAKKLGRSWEVGKAFEASAPCSAIVPAVDIGHPAKGRVWMSVNGTVRQDGDLDQMIWKVPEIVAYLSGLFELQAGDLIYSGTPAGVGPIQRGDTMEAGVDGVGVLTVKVV